MGRVHDSLNVRLWRWCHQSPSPPCTRSGGGQSLVCAESDKTYYSRHFHMVYLNVAPSPKEGVEEEACPGVAIIITSQINAFHSTSSRIPVQFLQPPLVTHLLIWQTSRGSWLGLGGGEARRCSLIFSKRVPGAPKSPPARKFSEYF